MNRLGIEIGDGLYPVPRTLAAPSICWRTRPPRVTVTGFGPADLIDVVEPDGTSHRINCADLARYRPRPREVSARSMEKKARPMKVSDAYTETPLW